jgi:hypothetical protein
MARSRKFSGGVISFEQAVVLFKEWGFVVEPGPGAGEVSLIIETPDHKTYCVYEAYLLPEIAAAILEVRRNRPHNTRFSDFPNKHKHPL